MHCSDLEAYEKKQYLFFPIPKSNFEAFYDYLNFKDFPVICLNFHAVKC